MIASPILSPTITLEDDYIFDQENTEKVYLYLNVAMKNEVTEGNHWHVNWKSIVFVDENGKLVQVNNDNSNLHRLKK